MTDCEGVIDDSSVFDFTCLMDPEAALTFTHGHFNLVVVYQYIKELQGY